MYKEYLRNSFNKKYFRDSLNDTRDSLDWKKIDVQKNTSKEIS